MISDLVLVLHVSLDEMYYGCTKVKSYMRKVFRNGQKFTILDQVNVRIAPGCPNNTFVRFVGRGEEFCRTDVFGAQKVECGDAVVQVIQSPHDTFSRMSGNEQHHLWCEYREPFSLKDALCGTDRVLSIVDHPAQQQKQQRHSVTALDFTIRLDDRLVFHDGYIFIARGLGMPLYHNPSEYGDLFILLHVQFPEHLSSRTRQQVRSILETEHPQVVPPSDDASTSSTKSDISSAIYNHAASSNVKFIRRKLSGLLRR